MSSRQVSMAGSRSVASPPSRARVVGRNTAGRTGSVPAGHTAIEEESVEASRACPCLAPRAATSGEVNGREPGTIVDRLSGGIAIRPDRVHASGVCEHLTPSSASSA